LGEKKARERTVKEKEGEISDLKFYDKERRGDVGYFAHP